MDLCKYALVGEENASNLRLSQILRKAYGNENVARFLELQYLEPFLASNQKFAIIVCLDLFSFDVREATDTVGRIRETYPRVVFNLYLDKDEYYRRNHELSEHWRERFRHYYKTFKEDADVEYEPIVRASLRSSQLEAIYNMAYKPVRVTPVFNRGVIQPDAGGEVTPKTPVAFIAYSKNDWQVFVSRLVSNLNKDSQRVWIDQDYIQGGDDWMDAISKALQVCDVLLLVLSPETLTSKYIKMEYRYFFRQGKPIIPILHRRLDQIPIELETIQYIDFTKGDFRDSYSNLLSVLSKHRSQKL